MSVTSYYSVNGMLLGEESVSLGRRDYLTDALGSVTATVNQTGVVQNTYRYKPYGGLLARTGTGNDPAFQWVGSQGYRQTARAYSDVYVRARHYSSVLGRWTTKVRSRELLLGEHPYDYALNNPIIQLDPSGLVPCKCCCEINSIGFRWRIMPPDWNLFGHILDTFVSMSKVKKDKSGDCQLKWEEKTSQPIFAGQKTGEWQDVCKIKAPPPFHIVCPNTTFDPARPQNCGDTSTWTDEDTPGVFKFDFGGPPNFERKLCIKITITDGCSGESTVIRFNQYIKVVGDVAGQTVTIVPPGTFPDLESYCR